jgi:hypothetical protein
MDPVLQRSPDHAAAQLGRLADRPSTWRRSEILPTFTKIVDYVLVAKAVAVLSLL